jgi:hypothetical protein
VTFENFQQQGAAFGVRVENLAFEGGDGDEISGGDEVVPFFGNC